MRKKLIMTGRLFYPCSKSGYQLSTFTPPPDTQKSSIFQMIMIQVLIQKPQQHQHGHWATYHFGTYFLEVQHDLMLVGIVRLSQVILFPNKINIIFGISTSINVGISKIYAEKQVKLYSLTFTRKCITHIHWMLVTKVTSRMNIFFYLLRKILSCYGSSFSH